MLEALSHREINQAVQAKKTLLLYRNGRLAFAATIINGSLLALINSHHGEPYVSFGWWLALVTMAAARFGLTLRYNEHRNLEASEPFCRRLYVAASLAMGVCWGASALVFIPGAVGEVRMFTSLVICGMVAGAVPTLSPVPQAFRSFAFAAVMPLLLLTLSRASLPMDWALAAVTMLFLLLVTASARYLHESLDASIRMGIEQSRHAHDLADSESRYRQILHHSPAGILQYDGQLVITYCNEQLARMLHAPADRLIGFDMKCLRDQRVLPALLAPFSGERGFYEGEYSSTLGDAKIWMSMNCVPLATVDRQSTCAIALIQDITDRRRSEEEIRSLAFFDALTNLPNRRLLLDRLEHATKASARHGQFGALILLDLDQFKQINDTQGHDTGDRMLVDVAQRLKDCLRAEDTVARLGGDEYVVLVENLGAAESAAIRSAEEIAEKIRNGIRAPFSAGPGRAEYFPSASVGVTLFTGRPDSIETLLKQADVALYQAKDAGRNAVRFFNQDMQETIDRRASLEAALHRALERHEFVLHYQPQVDHRGGMKGAEALVRWMSPEHGMVAPGQFIPLAEESGLILAIGRWVIESACSQLKKWDLDPRSRNLHLSVNVSARQIHHPDFVGHVRQALMLSGADPRRLVLELTESAVLDQIEVVIGRMEQLRALGVGFSLDDFGQGYSSLSHLKRLPLDQVKIDRAFVSGLPRDTNDMAIVGAILGICRSLGLQAVAEGVETREQADFLAGQGCDTFQGYLYGRPMPIEEFARQLEAEGITA
jgi:diguanylate cyclase (GGDEF)-like protein/PAS domain S-box-containing protein